MDRLMDIVSVVGGFLGLAVTPAIVAVITSRNKANKQAPADVEPVATFGLGFSVETAVERGDRIANDYLLDLRTQRDDAKADAKAALALAREVKELADDVEDRLDRANDALRAAGLPTF